MSESLPVIAVLGAGSWGTALAMQLARQDVPVTLWGRDAEQMQAMARERVNTTYLPDTPLPDQLALSDSLAEAVAGADHLLLACPSHAFAGLLAQIKPLLSDDVGIAWAAKGFEPGSGRLLHEVAQELLPGRALAVVTGPSFAREVALDLPTAVTVAATDSDFGETIARVLHGGSFRAYTSDDIIGAELGGAVKNVLAVATGICDGMRLGDNARAALITRGMAEMMRLGSALGAQRTTLMGLAGLGDLVLTCTGNLSRNRRLGLALGRGQSIDAALAEIGQVVEGIGTAEEVHRLALRHQLDMPITEQVHAILQQGVDPIDGVRRLLARGQRPEHD